MDIAFYHSQKAFYFYIEFIEQINHDQNAYLKLNSKDAILFVYKKTIYDIPYELRLKIHKSQDSSSALHEPLDVIRLFKNMYQNILQYFIQNMKTSSETVNKNPFSLEWNKRDFQIMTQQMERKMEKIIFLSFKQNVSYFELLDLFIQRFEKQVHYETYLQIIEQFLKKTNKIKYDFVLLKKNMEVMHIEPFFDNINTRDNDPGSLSLSIQSLIQKLDENIV
jgi:hypothetical protein